MIFDRQNDALRQPVECIITIDGEEIQALYPYLKEVTVEMNREAATVATLKFDTFRDETGAWLVQDTGGSDPLFIPWRKVIIEAVFGSYKEEVMRGYISKVNPNYPEDMSAAMVTVMIQDESILLDREHIRRSWVTTEENSISDGDIVREIAGDHQLDSEVQDGFDNVSLTNNNTYVQFLRDRAAANGYEFYIRKGAIHFHPPELGGEPQPDIMVYAGWATNCLRFNVQHDGHKPDEVAITRAPETGTELGEENFTSDLALLGRTAATSDTMGLKPFTWQLELANGYTGLEANARAQAKANENDWKIIGEGELDGALYGHVLLNFKTVYVDGTGETVGGLYYVDRVSHHFSLEGYRQSFRLLRNAIGDQGRSASSNPLASVIGGLF